MLTLFLHQPPLAAILINMPRHARIDYTGALHHVIIRGLNRIPIFKDNHDRKEFTRRLQNGLKETKLSCYAWALIPNHVHLLLKTGPYPLAKIMRCLLTGYALYFNRRHDRVGHLFQNRYKSILCDEEAYLLQLVRYIHLNPLRAGLVKNPVELNSFHWSGHSVLLGKQSALWQNTEEILRRFGSTVRVARSNYLKFVKRGVSDGQRPDLTGGGLIRSSGGWQNLLELRKGGERWWGDERILGNSDFVRGVLGAADEKLTKKEHHKNAGWNLERLLRVVAEEYGIDSASVKGRVKNRTASQARSLFAWWATTELDFTLTATAQFLNVSKPAIYKAAKRGKNITKEQNMKFPFDKVNK